MSFGFKKSRSSFKKTREKTPTPPPGRGSPRSPAHRTVKYVELYGTVALGALGASLSTNIINYNIPDGHGAELYALGIEPDVDAVPASNMLDTEIGYDGKLTGIKFLTNHLGRNSLPYGTRGNRQGIRLLDYPMRRGNLTPKFTDAMNLQIRVTMGAGGANLSIIRCRAKVFLYEEADCQRVFGVPLSQIATIPGGVQQSMPHTLFAEYVNGFGSAGAAQWENAYTKALKEYEEVKLDHLGVLPDANLSQVKLFDLRLKKEYPEFDPYWTCTAGWNALAFGDDDDYQPIAKLPSVVTEHAYTNTTMTVKVKDLAVASTVYMQLLGSYRRLK